MCDVKLYYTYAYCDMDKLKLSTLKELQRVWGSFTNNALYKFTVIIIAVIN